MSTIKRLGDSEFLSDAAVIRNNEIWVLRQMG